MFFHRMAKPVSGSETCINNLDGSQHEVHGNQGDLFPFPGFIINNKNCVEDHTPIAKIPCVSVQNRANSAKSPEQSSSTATSKTPPAEPSVSPEIQSRLCPSVLVSGAVPSTCYGAGHVISGVSDRRKCKARGILSVGRTNSLEQDIPEDILIKCRPSLVPFPAEASISWHLSPSYVDDDSVDGNGDYRKKLHQSGCTVNSPELRELVKPSSDKVIKKLSSTSHDTPNHEPLISLEERISSFDFNECSPFSADSLGSGNVMQTPNSDSSLERHASLSWLKEGIQLKHQFESEHESLSPEDNASPWDPPRLRLELEDLSSPSDHTNVNQFRENLDIHASWISNSTSNVSESQIRISWRDGVLSSSYDKEELDCCRFLSDEEVEADGLLKSPSFPELEVKADGKVKESPIPVKVNPCAESICNDDGGLIASGDSDWTLHYKNRSFDI